MNYLDKQKGELDEWKNLLSQASWTKNKIVMSQKEKIAEK
jgi:hypothetical protein